MGLSRAEAAIEAEKEQPKTKSAEFVRSMERVETYEVQPGAEPEDREDVSWGANRIEHIEDLDSWGEWTRAYQVVHGSETLTCFVAAKESSAEAQWLLEWLLLQAYRHRLRSTVGSAPAWILEEPLSASERILDDLPVPWMSEI